MNRIELCEYCLNRENNLKKGGILCRLTHEKPDFESTCPYYQENVQKKIKDIERQRERKSRQYPLGLKIFLTIVLVWGIYKILSLMFVGILVTF